MRIGLGECAAAQDTDPNGFGKGSKHHDERWA